AGGGPGPRLGQRVEMLGDGLPRHRQGGGKRGRGGGAVLGQGADDLSARGVAERAEDGVGGVALHEPMPAKVLLARAGCAPSENAGRSRTRTRVPSGTSSSVMSTRVEGRVTISFAPVR